MKKKLSALFLSTAFLLAFATINDVVTDVGSTMRDVQQITLEQIAKKDFDLPRYTAQVRDACRKLPPGVREATMMNLGKVVRDYVQSPGFQTAYMAYIEKQASGRRGGPPPVDEAKLAAEKKKKTDDMIRLLSDPQMLKITVDNLDLELQVAESRLITLKESPGSNVGKTKEELEKELAEKKALKELYTKDVESFKIKYAEYEANQQMEQKMKSYNKHNAQKQELINSLRDYKAIIAKQLRQFLDISATVDYNAQTVQKGDKMVFANPAYESKPLTWKLCFRCGREAMTGARKFAQEWLNEINSGK